MRRIIIVMAAACIATSVSALTLAYRDADSTAVHDAWPVPGVSLGTGSRCVIGSGRDSGRVHQHKFSDADETAIRADLGSMCLFEIDSIEIITDSQAQ